MAEQEGVIKFNLEHQYTAVSNTHVIDNLNAWRSLFFKLKLIGRDDQRYGGLAYGNISHRQTTGSDQFIISATQTSHIPVLQSSAYCLVTHADMAANRIISEGLDKPSSEALTHAMVYQLNPAIQAVIHVHSPEIWLETDKLQLPHTADDIDYGTPEMADNVCQLYQSKQIAKDAVFSMLGHTDGIVAYGTSINLAANLLIECFVNALKIHNPCVAPRKSD